MYNAGGAIDELRYQIHETVNKVYIEVKGCGIFGSYSSMRPKRCSIDSVAVEFDYDLCSGLIRFRLHELPVKGQKSHIVEIEFGRGNLLE